MASLPSALPPGQTQLEASTRPAQRPAASGCDEQGRVGAGLLATQGAPREGVPCWVRPAHFFHVRCPYGVHGLLCVQHWEAGTQGAGNRR